MFVWTCSIERQSLNRIFSGNPVLFEKSFRRQPAFDSANPVRTLSSVNDPTLRCPALWWAILLREELRQFVRTARFENDTPSFPDDDVIAAAHDIGHDSEAFVEFDQGNEVRSILVETGLSGIDFRDGVHHAAAGGIEPAKLCRPTTNTPCPRVEL